MLMSHRLIAFLFISVFLQSSMLYAQSVQTNERHNGSRTIFVLSNHQIEYSVVIDSNKIISDNLKVTTAWAQLQGGTPTSLTSDADFSMEIMWTDWQAPKKINNAENPVVLTKSDFRIARHEFNTLEGGKKELILFLQGNEIPLLARLTYQLDSSSWYIRSRLAIADTQEAGHFLQRVLPRACTVKDKITMVKEGGFGQPVAFTSKNGGGFFGVEYPAADNSIQQTLKGYNIQCGHEVEKKIGKEWLESESVVEGITPNTYVKQWFMKYVDDIRVAPLRPYTLYNSWYDLRSVEYPRVAEGNWMNEGNVFHIIELIRKNMIEKHNIPLDAFVLDDGWDIYESDWMLRDKQFPRGLKPIADELKKTNTGLGMWFGPTGGYSFRMKRVNWMKDHGYEVVGHTRNTAMLCLGGKNYSTLFKKRVTDFAGSEGVSYFKWDGIQFSCSEPDHGHPIGLYSRRAVMESVIEQCRAVREKNPNMFLNITSGTWLSPWWVKYANTIWMQGADYGYADVPSISPRDAAITYRDFILFDDFKNQHMWFPIANLMTHGIIKGNLEWLGGKEEPLDKFTNEALLYFARGVAMWELYISPDILTEGEWDAMGEAMHWARDRFPILSQTEMVGGDPTKGQSYGYTHFKGTKGIIAARNPSITSGLLKVELSPAQGLDPHASSLILEQVYPRRWVSPKFFKSGSTVEIPLDGYETAIYEIYPLSDAPGPLVAGIPFDVIRRDDTSVTFSIYGSGQEATILNPDQSVGKTNLRDQVKQHSLQPEAIDRRSLSFGITASTIHANCILDESVRDGLLSILLTPAKDSPSKKLPQMVVTMNSRADTAKFGQGEGAGESTWYTVQVTSGQIRSEIRIVSREETKQWTGTASVWMICRQQMQGRELTLTSKAALKDRPMPPRPFPIGVTSKNIKLGETRVTSSPRNY